MDKGLTQKELLEIVNRPGFTSGRGSLVTPYKLTFWQTKGAIPHPIRHGRGKEQGAIFYYSESVIDQIRDLIGFLQEKRSLDYAIIQLWLKGYGTVKYRPILQKSIKAYRKWWNRLRQVDEDGVIVLSEKALNMFPRRYDKDNNKRHTSRVVADASKRTGEEFSSFKFTLLRLVAGTDDILSDADKSAFLKGIGIETPDDMKGYTLTDFFSAISEACSPLYLEQLLDTGSEDELRMSYMLTSSALNVLQEFSAIKRALKDFPIYWMNPSQKLLVVIIWSVLNIAKKERDNRVTPLSAP